MNAQQYEPCKTTFFFSFERRSLSSGERYAPIEVSSDEVVSTGFSDATTAGFGARRARTLTVNGFTSGCERLHLRL